ncbi:MAG: hypothetical protein LBH19_13530 [Dysgonamonadaceae bacterium]|jgi:hypothetical protein|nr:hypothetical protein [Dysgonamonadaceae bacterium]
MSEVIPSEFARMCGVSPSVISRKIKNNTLVKNAAGLLDTDNPVNSRYAARRRLKSNQKVLEDTDGNVERLLKNFSDMSDYEISERIRLPQKLLGMSIRELVITYKGMEGLETYIKMLKDLTAADEKDQRVQERRLQLVEKDFIVARIFQYLDALMNQILEYPESAVDNILSLVQAKGADARLDVSIALGQGLSKIILGSKDQVIKELSGLRAKYQKEEKIEERLEAIEEAIDD